MENNSLYHHGTKGMKWGVRRYQNKDGSLTSAGKKRYANKDKEKPKELTPEEKKAKVVSDRSAKTFYENRKMFTYEETKSMRQLLQEDALIKNMIVKEPGKVAKFMDDTAIPWSKRISDLATNTVKIVTELDKLFPKDGADDKTGSDKTKSSKTDKDKSDGDVDDSAKKGGVKGLKWGVTHSPDTVEDAPKSSSGTSSSRKSDIYDVDWTDIGSSSKSSTASTLISAIGSASKVAEIAGSTVKSLPSASPKAQSFISDNISGYLPGPKEDD